MPRLIPGEIDATVLSLARGADLLIFDSAYTEEEFPSKCRVLFDANADRYLDVESLTFLIEGLGKNLEYGPDAAPHD